MQNYVYANPDLFSLTINLKPISMKVLFGLVLTIMRYNDPHNTIVYNRAIALNELKSHFDEETLKKFTSSRFSEGIKDLIKLGILNRTKEGHSTYTYNTNLLRSATYR